MALPKGFSNNQALFALALLAIVFLAGYATGRHSWAAKPVVQLADKQVALGNGAQDLAHSGSDGKTPAPAITPIPKGTQAVATADFHYHSKPIWEPLASAASGQPAPSAESAPPAVPLNCQPYLQDYTAHLTCEGDVKETLVADKAGRFSLVAQGVGSTVIDQGSFAAGTLDKGVPDRHPLGVGIAYPLGLLNSQMGIAVSYDFNLLPVTAGADLYTQGGRAAGMATLVWHFRGL